MAANPPTRSSRVVEPAAFQPARWATLSLEHAEVTRGPKGIPRFVISTEDTDLEGDVVVQAGLKPVGDRVPAQLDHSGRMRDLVGHWENIETRGKKTYADLILLPESVQWEAAEFVRALHEAGVRMAASIGFVPDRTEGGYELIRDVKNEWVTGIRWNRSTLIEASIVMVPANPTALSTKLLDIGRSFGLDAGALQSFVMSDASQQLLRGMPAHDARARAAAAVQKATSVLERGRTS